MTRSQAYSVSAVALLTVGALGMISASTTFSESAQRPQPRNSPSLICLRSTSRPQNVIG